MIGSVLRPVFQKICPRCMSHHNDLRWSGSFFVPIRDYQARARSFEGCHR
ncbi:hypothetical protein LptCag_2259 [Leptospirillum ferriphilum]|uniref:Uncharacterized protein n=1 Tax=Leptospirillum ferriphilum TaxID=178606 RepID=A0A094WE64_9BACT|nr:hypothetical protein LptCag_2259 [Leptospirillum ferriphilum]